MVQNLNIFRLLLNSDGLRLLFSTKTSKLNMLWISSKDIGKGFLFFFKFFWQNIWIEKYFYFRSSYLMFNDDIQGTAATTLAGKFWALHHMFSRKKTKFRIMKNIFYCFRHLWSTKSSRFISIKSRGFEICCMWSRQRSSWSHANHSQR